VLALILLGAGCGDDDSVAGGPERDAGMLPAGSDAGGTDAGAAVDVDAGAARDAGPDIPVDLPGSIEGVEPESQANHPPMIDGNGNLYRVTESGADDGNNPRMMRSTDSGATWSEVDAGNRPSARDLEGCWQLQVGTAIYLTVAANNNVWFSVFHTSDAPDRPDQWVVDEEVVDELDNSGGVVQFSSVARTSDGQFWLFHSGTVTSERQSIQYRRRSVAGEWSSPQLIGESSGSWTGPRGILGAGDVTHVFYADYENAELLWRRLEPTGTLSSPTRLDVDSLSDERIPHTNAVYYDAGGREVLTVGYGDGDGALWTATITDGVVGTPQLVTSDPVLADPNVAANDSTVAHLAVDGTTVHVLWVDLESGDVLHSVRPHGGDWSAAEVAWDSGSNIAWWVYGNVYERGNRRRLGFTYDIGEHPDDEGNIEYDEITLTGR
jgi:hypothetical protein